MGIFSKLFKRRTEREAARGPDRPAAPTALAEAFAYKGMYLASPESSNVAGASYDFDKQKLRIDYRKGGSYEYSGVTAYEAITYALVGSKGSWCWQFLRVRGSKTGARKDFTKLES